MALIKRGLGARHPDTHVCRQAGDDRHTLSLEARTAELLQRLRAQRVGQTMDLAGTPDEWQADLNRVQITGHLAREPLLYDVADHHVAALELVSERRWRTASPLVVRTHILFQLTAWEDLADYCGRHLHAGDRLSVEGQLRPSTGRAADEIPQAYEIVLDRVVLLTPAVVLPERVPERRGSGG
ncbi:MAG: single-stranded DNA-binding protein [Chloroflexales bacterium]|nr:single-stranded DNA-binding protein [Chloroflexales bacterium]